MSVILNEERIGNFTSSEIYRLMKPGSEPMTPEELKQHKKENPNSKRKNKETLFGEKALTYIEEKAYEIMIDRCLTTEVNTQVITWGHVCETYLHTQMGWEYQRVSDETKINPNIPGHAGSCDYIVPGVKIAEQKSYYPKNFVAYSNAIINQDVEFLRENFEEEYWQAVSNAIINQVPQCELICFMPYIDELPKIKEIAWRLFNTEGKYQFKWIITADVTALPYLPKTSKLSNINTFCFEPSKEDIENLEHRVKEAIKIRDSYERN